LYKQESMTEQSPDAPIVAQSTGPVLTVTLRREPAGNAVDAALVEALLAALDAIDPRQTRLLVLRGAGRGFCSGFDLSGLEAASDGDLLLRFVRIETLLQRLRNAPVPSLALAHGFAFGAGADLFAACTWRIAAPGTRFAFPGAGFGIVLGTRRLTSLVGPQAAIDLTVRGGRLDAERALALGLATGIAPVEGWEAAVATLLGELAASTPEVQPLLRRAALPDDMRDADLADLVRSAALPGLGARIRAYAEAARAARQSRGGESSVRR
jgi:enoyl-CoA hydratase/carnithine racemase